MDGNIEMSARVEESHFFCPVVGGFQTQEQVMASAGGSEDSPAGFGQSGQSFYNSRAVPRGGPRNPRGMMNGYRGSSNGFRGTRHKGAHGFVRHFEVSAPFDSNVSRHQGAMKAIVPLSLMLRAVVMVKPSLTIHETIPTTPTSG